MISETEALARYPGAVSFRYGDSAALNLEILSLVLSGKKTVICDAVAGFEKRGEAVPVAGRTDVCALARRVQSLSETRRDLCAECGDAGGDI